MGDVDPLDDAAMAAQQVWIQTNGDPVDVVSHASAAAKIRQIAEQPDAPASLQDLLNGLARRCSFGLAYWGSSSTSRMSAGQWSGSPTTCIPARSSYRWTTRLSSAMGDPGSALPAPTSTA